MMRMVVFALICATVVAHWTDEDENWTVEDELRQDLESRFPGVTGVKEALDHFVRPKKANHPADDRQAENHDENTHDERQTMLVDVFVTED